MSRRNARDLWTKPSFDYMGNMDSTTDPRDQKWRQTLMDAAPDGEVDERFIPVVQASMRAHIYQRDYDDYMQGDNERKERMRLYQGIDDANMVGHLKRMREEARADFHTEVFAYHDELHKEQEALEEERKERKREIRNVWLPVVVRQHRANMQNARYGPDGRHEVFGDFREDRRQNFKRKVRALAVDPEDFANLEILDQSEED